MTTRLYLHYGDQRLVEPNARSVRAMWAELGEYLRLHYSAGVYRDKTQVNAILQSAFKFLKRKLDHLVRRLASREFMEFVLHQYNLTAEKWAGLPSNHNIENMRQHSESAVRRRALKYLAECTAMRSPPEFAPLHFSNLFAETEQAILCTEMMVNLYQISDRTYCLFPDHTQLTLFPSKEEEPVPIQILPLPSYKTLDIDLNRRIAKETEGRKKWFPDPTFDRDVERQGDTLNTSFKEAWGLTYQDFCSVLTGVIENAIHAPGSYPITFYPYQKLVTEIASSGIATETVKQILYGFTVHRAGMATEGRQLWKPKQIHRAYQRGFFEFPHRLGSHLTWSRAMAYEVSSPR